MTYLATEAQWIALAKTLDKYEGPIGLDSEFEGVVFEDKDIENDEYWKHSCVKNADITVWSLAILSNQLHPRGYFRAKGCVLGRGALHYPPLKRILEDPKRIKPAHNSNVDVHAFYNAGIDVQGVVNTQSLARWMLPGEMMYNLDFLGEKFLGEGKTEDFFGEVLRVPNIITIPKERTIKSCSCGVAGCRLRKARYDADKDVFIEHNKTAEIIVEPIEKQDGWLRISQWEIVNQGPSHPLWQRYIDYAKRDAVVALQLYDYLTRLKTKTEVPWYQNSTLNI